MVSATYPRPIQHDIFLFEPAGSPRLFQKSGILELLAQRYVLRLLVELRKGETRFNRLSRRVDATPNTLRARLRELESAEIVERIVHSPMPPSVSIVLTERGRELADLIGEIQSWDRRWTSGPDPGGMAMAAERRKPYRP